MGAVLAVFGALWLLTEITTFFSEAAGERIQEHWYVFVLLGLMLVAFVSAPKDRVCYRLAGRDVSVEVRLGDMFRIDGAFVIGTNTAFATEVGPRMISEVSAQGAFTRRYYLDPKHLLCDVQEQLKECEPVDSPEAESSARPIYPIGTVVRLDTHHSEHRRAYWVAIAALNEYGTARGSFEDLKVSLANLWEFVATRGDYEPIMTPILGSGYSRLQVSREAIIREIVDSFIAACSSKQFTEKLTIVVHPKDYLQHEIDLQEIGQYLRHVCRYTQFKQESQGGAGEGIALGM